MLPGAKVLAMPGLRERAGVLSFVPLKKDVAEVGTRLAKQEIAVRTGLHCASFAHKSAGTLDTGTVRVSFSDFNTRSEVYRLLAVLHDLLH